MPAYAARAKEAGDALAELMAADRRLSTKRRFFSMFLRELIEDARSIRDRDPAARSTAEVFLLYPASMPSSITA